LAEASKTAVSEWLPAASAEIEKLAWLEFVSAALPSSAVPS